MKALTYIATAALAFVTNTSYAQNVVSDDPAYFKVDEILWKAKPSSYRYGAMANAVDPKTGRSITVRSEGFKTDGGVHSGGETLVQIQGTFGVLDLYRFNRKAFFDKTPGHKLPYTRAFRQYEIDRLSNDSSIFQRTMAQVEKWRDSSPYVVRFVQRALQELPVYYVNYKLNFAVNKAEIPSDVKFESVRLGAWFMSEFGAFLDKNAFQSLSEKNQIAFLIHEALRQEQFNHYSDFSNEAIQKLTAHLVDDPQKDLTLDVPEFFTADRNEFFEKRNKLRTAADETVALLCQKLNRCDFQASQMVPEDSTQSSYDKAYAYCDQLMKVADPVIKSLSEELRSTYDQEKMDKLNTRLAELWRIRFALTANYHGDLVELGSWIGFRDVNYTSEQLNMINRDYDWLPEVLRRTNNGYKYAGGKSPVLNFMKEMRSAGFFK